MDQAIKLSVGIPSYNQSKYIVETVNSLLAQTVAPYEIIICENHSTDDTMEVLEQFDGQITVIHPPGHLSMMENWNYLVSQLKGNWFSILSSDDTVQPDFIQEIEKAIKDNYDNAVLIGAGYNVIDKHSFTTESRFIMSLKAKTSFPQNFLERLTTPKFSFACFACKTEAWQKAGGFPKELKLFGDWGLWLRLSPLGDFIYINKIIANYRSYTDDRSTNRKGVEIADYFFIYESLIPTILTEYNLGLKGKYKRRIGHKFNDIENNWLPYVNNKDKVVEGLDNLFKKYQVDKRLLKKGDIKETLVYKHLKKSIKSLYTILKK